MENLVSDEDFMMILLTSLPESWDNYMTSFLGSSGNKPMISSHKLIAVLLEEDQCHKGRESSGTVLHVKTRDKGKSKCSHGDNKDKKCYNCHKKGHIASECWAKGGGKEGQGLKGQKGSEGGITPTRHRTMSSQVLTMLRIWLLSTVLVRSQNTIGFSTPAPLPMSVQHVMPLLSIIVHPELRSKELAQEKSLLKDKGL